MAEGRSGINYGAGAGRRGASQHLARALQQKLDAQNVREAEDQRRKGLFGSGITSQNMRDLASTGMDIAKFGDQRRTEQMDRAEKSFERRMGGMQKRFDYWNERAKKGGTDEDFAMARGLMDAMNKERHNFEKANQEYGGKGLFATGFGGDAVDYTGANVEDTERGLIEQAMAKRRGVGVEGDVTIPGSFAATYGKYLEDPGTMDDEAGLPTQGMMAGVTRPVTNIFGEQGRGTGYGPMPGSGPPPPPVKNVFGEQGRGTGYGPLPGGVRNPSSFPNVSDFYQPPEKTEREALTDISGLESRLARPRHTFDPRI